VILKELKLIPKQPTAFGSPFWRFEISFTFNASENTTFYHTSAFGEIQFEEYIEKRGISDPWESRNFSIRE